MTDTPIECTLQHCHYSKISPPGGSLECRSCPYFEDADLTPQEEEREE